MLGNISYYSLISIKTLKTLLYTSASTDAMKAIWWDQGWFYVLDLGPIKVPVSYSIGDE